MPGSSLKKHLKGTKPCACAFGGAHAEHSSGTWRCWYNCSYDTSSYTTTCVTFIDRLTPGKEEFCLNELVFTNWSPNQVLSSLGRHATAVGCGSALQAGPAVARAHAMPLPGAPHSLGVTTEPIPWSPALCSVHSSSSSSSSSPSDRDVQGRICR